MNIAITATEPSLDAKVDPRFGRCPYFLIVDTETLKYEAVENANVTLGGGAGVQSALLMAEKGVQFILTGNCGPNAYQALSAGGIGVIVGCSGTGAEVVEQFKAGQLNATDQPNVASKSGLTGASSPAMGPQGGLQPPPMTGGGMGGGMGRGGGRGMARGMGRGGGGGMRAGFAQGPGATPQQPAQPMTKDDELAMLKQQAEAMSRQMQQVQERIRQLEKEG